MAWYLVSKIHHFIKCPSMIAHSVSCANGHLLFSEIPCPFMVSFFIGTSQPCFIKKQRTYRCTSYSKPELTKARNWKWRLLCTSSYRCALFSQLRESRTERRALLSISQLLASSAAAVEALLNILPCRSQKYHDSGAMLAFLQQACPIGNLGSTVLQL